jgi:sulfonate transport system ATP-binding protein
MLTMKQVGKSFANGTRAISDFSLTIAHGEIVVLIGASGCGKSTLLRLASGLDMPSEGEIVIDSERVRRPDPRINMVFQEPRLFPWLTVAGNVGFGLANAEPRIRSERVERVLAKVGLEGFGGRWPKELSGGQAQRVSLARALVVEPKVILLDEPFSALDAFTRHDLQRHLLALWQESRPTMLMVTHDIDEALIFADRVIVMRPWPGRITEEFRIDLARDRDPDSREFEALKRQLHASLSRSMDRRRNLAA